MLISLFIILSTVLGGGSEDPFILPKAEKVVKQAIEEPARKDQAALAMKSYSKQWKKLLKSRKKQAKSVSKLNKDRSADPQAIADLFQDYRSKRRGVKDSLITFRLDIQKLMTDEEWAKIIDQLESVKPKKVKKQEKAELKSQLKQDKKLMAIESEIQAAFSDPEKIEEVKIDLDKFEDDLTNLLFETQEGPTNVVEIMRNRNATKDQLTEVIMKQEDYRAKAHASFLELRTNLVEISTDDNWSKIAKALNKLI